MYDDQNLFYTAPLEKFLTLQKPCESPVKSCFQPCLRYFRAVNWL